MSVIVKWYGKEIQNLIDRAALSGITAAAISVENEIIKKIDVMKIVDTGRYKGSISFKTKLLKSSAINPIDNLISEPKEFQALIGTNLFYAPYLEYGHKQGSKYISPRPAIRLAWDGIKGKLDRIFTLQFKKIFK